MLGPINKHTSSDLDKLKYAVTFTYYLIVETISFNYSHILTFDIYIYIY